MDLANGGLDYKIDLKSEKVWVNRYVLPKIKSSKNIWSKNKVVKECNLKTKIWKIGR